TAVVLLGALLAVLRHRRVGRGLGSVAILSFAVPGTTLAVATLLAYGPWLRDTVALILVAYVAKFWALGHRTVAGAADGLPADLSRAARVSGAGAATSVRTVVVPLLRPALGAAWLAVFLFGLHELTMSSLLYGPGSKTLAVVILNLAQLGDPTVTSALAVLLTALLLVLATPLLLLVRAER
ncbi:MAG: ABC transporter permease subunit, partial [Actinomycetota bacterium]|nr:ABC transporter permease subunit [Actinomycetota bacterium]